MKCVNAVNRPLEKKRVDSHWFLRRETHLRTKNESILKNVWMMIWNQNFRFQLKIVITLSKWKWTRSKYAIEQRVIHERLQSNLSLIYLHELILKMFLLIDFHWEKKDSYLSNRQQTWSYDQEESSKVKEHESHWDKLIVWDNYQILRCDNCWSMNNNWWDFVQLKENMTSR